jgi:hypothetical protein
VRRGARLNANVRRCAHIAATKQTANECYEHNPSSSHLRVLPGTQYRGHRWF